MIFDLKIKRHEISFLSKDNFKKNFIAAIGAFISLTAIYFAYVQNKLNKNLLNVDRKNTLQLEGYISAKISNLEERVDACGDQKISQELGEIKQQLKKINKR
jgi:hypothetical protein